MKNKVPLPIKAYSQEELLDLEAKFRKSFPKEIKKFRQTLRWSVRDFAKMMNITGMSYDNKERGKTGFSAFESYVLETMREQYNQLISKK